MKRVASWKAFCALGLTAVVLSGCVAYTGGQGSRMAGDREDVLLMREDNRRLAGRVEGLELELQRLQRELTAQQMDQQRFSQSQNQGADAKWAELDRRIQAVNQAREKDKQEIIDRLTKTIEQLMKSQSAARPAATRTTNSGYGYEHVVGPGETLSHIATAYGATTKAIIDANNLKNPDRLQVGQKLFIPE